MTNPVGGGAPAGGGGGIVQFIRLMLDKASLRAVTDQIRSQSAQWGKAINDALDRPPQLGPSRTWRLAGAQAGSSFAKGLDEMLQGPQVRAVIKKYHREFSRLAIVPDPTALAGDTERRIRSQYKGKWKSPEFAAALAEARIVQQLAGTRITLLGKLFRVMGGDAFSASVDVQKLNHQIKGLHGSTHGATKPVSLLQRGLDGLRSTIFEVARGFGLYLVGYKFVTMVKQALTVAGEAEASFGRLAVTLNDFGIRFEAVRGPISQLIIDQTRLGYTQDQTVEILATLIQITGDYDKSLKAVGVTTDLMVARHMSLETAAKQVGRAIIGDIGSLQRHAIFLEKNRDALQQLSERFGGEAAAKARTFQGTIHRLTAQWKLFQQELGRRLIEGGVGKAMEGLIVILEEMRGWVSENKFAFQALGAMILATFKAIAVVIWGFGHSLKLVQIAIGAIFITIQSIPAVTRIAFHGLMFGFLNTIHAIALAMDKVFKTDFATNIDRMKKDMKGFAEDAQKDLKDTWTFFGRQAKATWAGQGSFEAPLKWGTDGVLQGAGHIQARRHQRLRDQILTLRRLALSDNTEVAVIAQEELRTLNSLLEKQKEEWKENRAEAQQYEVHLIKIKEIFDRLDDRSLSGGNAADRLQAAEISRLAKVSLLRGSPKESGAALTKLGEIYNKMQVRLERSVVGSSQYFRILTHIKAIEDARLAVMGQEDSLLDDEIRKLSDMVELDQNREQALVRLSVLEAEQRKKVDNTTLGLDAQIKARRRLVSIEQARVQGQEQRDTAVSALIEQLKHADMRKDAERELNRIKDEENRKLRAGTVLQKDRERTLARILSIEDALAGTLDIKDFRRRIDAANELSRTWSTHLDGVRAYRDLEAEAVELLEKKNLTESEALQISAALARIRERLAKVGEPSTNFLTDLKETFWHELPTIVEQTADHMATVMTDAFTYISLDAKRLGQTLSSIPKGLAQGFANALKDIARMKAKENLAWALEETARGVGALFTNPAAAAGHFSSAAEHTAAAAGWAALGGVAGGLANKAGAAYANATPWLNSSGRESGGKADAFKAAGPDIIIYVDGVDPRNPRHQDLVGATASEYAERWGGTITIKPRAS